MMKYAMPVRAKIVPEWKFCYYNYKILSELVQVLEKLSTIRDTLRYKLTNQLVSLKQQQVQHLQRIFIQIKDALDESNRLFFKCREDQMEVVFLFSQMKQHELVRKLQFYRQICNKKNKICRTLYENVYIQLMFLLNMLEFNLQKDSKILQLQKSIVDKYSELDVPEVNYRKIQRVFKRVRLLKSEIQEKYFCDTVDLEKHKIIQLRQLCNFYYHINKTHIYWFGFWCGTLVTLLLCIILLIVSSNIDVDSYPEFARDFPIWRGLSYFVLYNWVIGLNVLFFEEHQINYKLIFNFDKNNMPTSTFLLIAAAVFTTMYLLFIGCQIAAMANIQFLNKFSNYSLLKGIAWLIVIGYITLPLPIFQYRGRLYFLKLFIFMLLSPIIGVDFKMHWLAEQFASFKQPFHDIAYTISFYFFDQNSSYQTAVFVGVWIGVSIYCLRISQGIRMGIATNSYFSTPLFRGAFKCVFNITTIITSYFYRINRTDLNLIIWIISAVWSTLFAFHFDIRYDWGLLQCSGQHPLLREKRIIQTTWVYYVAIILNFFMRIAWVLTISTDILQAISEKPYVFTMFIAYIEIFRRSLWNIFRIEKQQVENCHKFHAVVDYRNIQNKVIKDYLIQNPEKVKAINKYREQIQPIQRTQAQQILVRQAIKFTDNNLIQVQEFLTDISSYIKQLESQLEISYK